MDFVRRLEIDPSLFKRLGCEYSTKWPHQFVLAIFDFTQYGPGNHAYTMITQLPHGLMVTPGEMAAMSAIDHAILDAKTGNDTGWELHDMKVFSPPDCLLPRIFRAETMWGMIIGIAVVVFPWYALDIAKQITKEKQGTIRCVLEAYGVQGLMTSCSWGLFFQAYAVFLSAMSSVAVKIPFPETRADVLFLSFFLYNVAQGSFIILLVALLGRKTSRLASVYLFILVIGGALVFAVLLIPATFQGQKLIFVYIISIFFPAPLLVLARYMSEFYRLYVSDYPQKMSPFEFDQMYGVGACMLLLLGDAVLYLTIAAVVEALQDWKGFSKPSDPASPVVDQNEEKLPEPEHHDGISLHNVSKSYGEVSVLTDITVEFPTGKVAVLLGRNGAGKSTTTNVMTGFLEPSAGMVQYNGLELRSNRNEIVSDLAYLPQENILFEYMSLYEHIKFYGWLKGLSTDEIQKAVNNSRDYGLESQVNVPGTRLSGGEKRKLGMFIAYLGKPKYVILDEPTSGIDVFSSRTIWDVILRNRHETTTVISTHRIEDAEALADRVVIIDSGRICSEGTPLELKGRLGDGFSVVLDTSGMNELQAQDIQSFVAKSLELSQDQMEMGKGTVKFKINRDIGQSEAFLRTLTTLEDKLDKAGQGSYGVLDTTLGDVYHAAVAATEDRAVANADISLLDQVYEQPPPPNIGGQFGALLWRRLMFLKPSLPSVLFFQLMPFILAMFSGFIGGFQSSTPVVKGLMKQPIHELLGHRWLIVTEDADESTPIKMTESLYSIVGAPKSFLKTRNQTNSLGGGCKCRDPSSETCEDERRNLSYTRSTLSGDEIYHARITRVDEIEDLRSIITSIHRPPTPRLVGIVKSRTHGNKTATSLTLSEEKTTPYVLAGVIDRLIEQRSTTVKIKRSIERGTFESSDQSYATRAINNVVNMMKPAFLIFAFPIVSASIRHFVGRDFKTGSKHLLDLAGVPQVVYWLSNFVVDIIQLLPVLALLLCTTEWWLSGDVRHFALYPFGILTSVTYTYFFISVREGPSFVVGTIVDHIMAISGLLIGAIAHIPTKGEFRHVMTPIAYGVAMLGRAHPLFFIGDTIAMLAHEEFFQTFACENTGRRLFRKDAIDCESFDMHYWIAAGMALFFFFLYGALLGFTPSLRRVLVGVCCRKRIATEAPAATTIDTDVQAEEGRIRSMLPNISTDGRTVEQQTKVDQGAAAMTNSEILPIGNVVPAPEMPPLATVALTKSYDRHRPPVVDNVTFSAEKAECFGLLGVNGAGKTTTFRMLTGQITPDSGECYMYGEAYSRRPSLLRGRATYCPQEDSLCEYLTTAQHIDFFGQLAGYPTIVLYQLVEMFLESLALVDCRNKYVRDLSGGNKRKVQLICSVIRSQQVTFLDEPTTGLDPTARQLAWNIIGTVKKNTSVVLTSHTLDDCEALCDRVVIMVAGRFRCIGTLQYLKNKLGKKFTFRLKAPAEVHGAIDDFIRDILNGKARQIDNMPNWLVYEIHADDLGKLSHLYEVFMNARSKFGVETAIVSQVTLQDVFLQMAKDAEEQKQANEKIDAGKHLGGSIEEQLDPACSAPA